MGLAVKELPHRLVLAAFPSGYKKVLECAVLLHTDHVSQIGVNPPELHMLAVMPRN